MNERAIAATLHLFYFLALLFMALLTLTPEETQPKRLKQLSKRKKIKQQQEKEKQTSSWDNFKNLLSCKQAESSRVHNPTKSVNGYSKLSSSCSSICSFKDVVHRADNSPESSTVGQETALLSRKPVSGSTRSYGGNTHTSSLRGMQFRKLSGCYECHTIADISRFPAPRNSVCVCSQCGEVFTKIESLELHQAVRHAELGAEDSGRNIVEIIFKSSWLKKDNPVCKIDRILKVHNTQRTIQRFEDCRDAVKLRALNSTKKNPRCAADGNELLRFHCATLTCSLGSHGSSSLCSSVPGCGVCTIIRHGFHGKGVRTTASSGKAHDSLKCMQVGRAMLVCRVIAGRVKRLADDTHSEEEAMSGGSYDSVAGGSGIYSNLDELVLFNPRAILPCFVVIYSSLVS